MTTSLMIRKNWNIMLATDKKSSGWHEWLYENETKIHWNLMEWERLIIVNSWDSRIEDIYVEALKEYNKEVSVWDKLHNLISYMNKFNTEFECIIYDEKINRAFRINNSFDIEEIKEYCFIGSWAKYAQAIYKYDTESDICSLTKKIFETVSKIDIFTGKDFNCIMI